MFRELHRQPNDLARYTYVLQMTPKLPVADQQLGLQMLATVENELGLYNEALLDFPLKRHVPPAANSPQPAAWVAEDAVEVITKLAANRRLVMVNEAHHDAHTRLLTLALLPRLRALGFNYFAAEALSAKDKELMQRGYPVQSSGTEYLHEPTYGDIVRTAIKLGFTVIAYEADADSQSDRESGQARNLYEKTFARDPHAKLFVHAGYAHIDKAKGRLGNVEPMAMYLQQLSGIEPLSIDQTAIREQIPPEQDIYHQLVTSFPSHGPIVLINRATGKPWSASPNAHDATVLLPPAAAGVVEGGLFRKPLIVRSADRDHLMLPTATIKQRPNWLMREGERRSWPISARMCRTSFPCVVDAIRADESEDAIAADRYAFTGSDVVSRLYLPMGRYRLRASNAQGKTITEQTITVEKP
ncbi:hypothetical protein PY254_08100 [Rhodanobacter sp. AS-Z3]|uniref:hypothetical protein n=1 Tax=Rhodanobacter sp. AS-Z3 TaxID=3031330 RepID=UPI0024795384|nr:hypothetical protein [Rhodanobacter sp. AS-Z3]WEN16614.1 hypothetical protein PY254_08100 [Rhodanobacter sp. AS-Z3]